MGRRTTDRYKQNQRGRHTGRNEEQAQTHTQTETDRERPIHAETCMDIWTQHGIDIRIETRTETHKDRQTQSWTDSGRKGQNEEARTDTYSQRQTKTVQPKTGTDKDKQEQKPNAGDRQTQQGIRISAAKYSRVKGGRLWLQVVGIVPRVTIISCLGHGHMAGSSRRL